MLGKELSLEAWPRNVPNQTGINLYLIPSYSPIPMVVCFGTLISTEITQHPTKSFICGAGKAGGSMPHKEEVRGVAGGCV